MVITNVISQFYDEKREKKNVSSLVKSRSIALIEICCFLEFDDSVVEYNP